MYCYYLGKVFYTDPISGEKNSFMGCNHPNRPSMKAHDCEYCSSFATKKQANERRKEERLKEKVNYFKEIIIDIQFHKKWLKFKESELIDVEKEIKDIKKYGKSKQEYISMDDRFKDLGYNE